MSSILKQRKIKEDLNQLLPNNDDGTTTSDIQQRKVSFASIDEVKEYETAPECDAVINTPPAYDEDSADQSQILGQNRNVGQIDDSPLKISGDSSMEMTVITQIERTESISEMSTRPLNEVAPTRKDILEKIIESRNNANQKWKWKLKFATEDEWVFQFFYDQLELRIKFNSDDSNTCSAVCQYVQPLYIKYYEICKIAVEYLIRKNESKLKQLCQTVEDVPYLLKLIELDIIYIKNFVADILRLCESEIFQIKNGRAVFYVYSFKNLFSAKIQMNISRLERLSVGDIQVEEILGKVDINLVRKTFFEVGRSSDFVSQFVKKLWMVLDE